jgi:hypothetical protein
VKRGIPVAGGRGSADLPVFRGVTDVVELIDRLCRRSRVGDDTSLGDRVDTRGEMRTRRGLPLVCLIRPSPDGRLLGFLARRLDTANRSRVPHCLLRLSPVEPDASEQAEPEPDDQHRDVRKVRKILAAAANQLGGSRNAQGGRIRFRRFSLLLWLMSQDLTAVDSARRESELRARLRRRDIVQWFDDTITSLSGDIPTSGWWNIPVRLIRLLPPLFFMLRVSGRVPGFGAPYRWFLRQPNVAPGGPGGFLGFAERLTGGTEGWQQEDPEQLARLLTNAFLEDLRRAWRFPWRLSGARRMTYAVLLLGDVTENNGGFTLLRQINDVRNETGRFDPLLLISVGDIEPSRDPDGRPAFAATNAEAAYVAWHNDLRDERRARTATAWYLRLSAEDASDDEYDDIEQRLAGLRRQQIPRPPWWGRRIVPVTAVVVVLAALVTTYTTWSYQHCGGGWRWPSPGATLMWVDGQCVGVTDGGYVFDPSLAGVTQTIAAQNQQSEQAYRQDPTRAFVTLVDLQALTPTPGEPDALTAERESLEGAAVAQLQAINDPTAPLIRLLIGNAGTDLAHGTDVAQQLAVLPATDAPLVGVVGMDKSTLEARATVRALAGDGLPVVASSLSDDELADSNPLYYQVSPQNQREAAVAAAFATTLRAGGRINDTVTIVHPDNPDDAYASTLTQDALGSFARQGFQVRDVLFAHRGGPATAIAPGVLFAEQNGKNICGYRGLVYYAGDGVPDFNDFVQGLKDCPTPPALLADDDVTRYVADTKARESDQSVPYWYTTFAIAPITPPQGPARNFYAGPYGLYALFPSEQNGQSDNPSRDAHAALTYDAVKVMTEAVKHLREGDQQLPLTPGHLWREITNIRGPQQDQNNPAIGNNNDVQGVTGLIDYGSSNGHRPVNKLITILQVANGSVQAQPAFSCGVVTGLPQNPRPNANCPVDQ